MNDKELLMLLILESAYRGKAKKDKVDSFKALLGLWRIWNADEVQEALFALDDCSLLQVGDLKGSIRPPEGGIPVPLEAFDIPDGVEPEEFIASLDEDEILAKVDFSTFIDKADPDGSLTFKELVKKLNPQGPDIWRTRYGKLVSKMAPEVILEVFKRQKETWDLSELAQGDQYE